MRILFLTNHLNPGGISSYVFNLSLGLKKRSHKVFLASSGGGLLEKFQQEGVVYFSIPIRTKSEISPKILISAFFLRKIIINEGIEVIHSNSRTTEVLAFLLGKLVKVRHVFTCHGFFRRNLSRKLFPCWPEKVIAVSSQVKEHLEKDFGLESRRIALIPHGIDTKRFSPLTSWQKEQAKRRLNLNNQPVVGILARLCEIKGHFYLLKAMSEVLRSFPQAQLLIAGEGPLRKKLEKMAEDLRIKENVFFVDNSIDSQEVLSATDIFVLPSLQEGLGLALMEAMSMGLAVIGSNVGGIKSLIQDRKNGLLVTSRNPFGLAEKIKMLLADKDTALKLGDQARNFILENFSLSKMVYETEKVYEEVCNEAFL